jgi:uncharacterized membrane protein
MNSTTFESTYAMLVRSEKEEHTRSETAAYLLLILSIAFSVWQAAHMRVTIPENLTPKTVATEMVTQWDRA